MNKPLTVPLAQVALSHSRPAPPSSRPMHVVPPTALEPDRQHVDKPEAAEVAAKKKRARAKVTAETRAVAVARVEKLIGAGNPTGEAIATVAKELGVSESSVYNWRTDAGKSKSKSKSSAAPEPEARPARAFDGLDLILDIIELAERAKKGLSKSQRARLRAALNERLS